MEESIAKKGGGGERGNKKNIYTKNFLEYMVTLSIGLYKVYGLGQVG